MICLLTYLKEQPSDKAFSAVGNARLFGLEADLNITPGQYNMVLTSFFFTYALFEMCVYRLSLFLIYCVV